MPNDVEEQSASSAGSMTNQLTFGSLFAGIGGFDLGLERAGMRCEWQVEIDPYARAVLAKHWPEVRRWEDVRTFPPKEGEWGVDVICGGFPCQDISVAGKGAGLAGARSGLWYEFARIIGELRPRFVIVENVAALLTRGADVVLGTLASLGYDAEWHVIPASAVGAPHRRERVWIVAYANDQGQSNVPVDDVAWRGAPQSAGGDVSNADGLADALRGDGTPGSTAMAGRRLHAGGGQRNRGTRCAGQAGQGACDVADAKGGRVKRHRAAREQVAQAPARSRLLRCDGAAQGETHWSAQPGVGCLADGFPNRLAGWGDAMRCLGNAVVPQIVEVIGRAIVEAA